MKSITNISTGITGLDKILNNLHLGDNVVWQVDSINDYRHFLTPYVNDALENNRKVVYFRFANHEQLLSENSRIRMINLNAYSGFESFSKSIYTIATEMGEEAFYVFDCLSSLLSAWATDLMIGNFFVITCPYLYKLNTLAYFAIYRNCHDHKTIARIRETTQVLIEVYKTNNNYYIHPLKVENRYSPTMFLPHLNKGDDFIPITSSSNAADFIEYVQKRSSESTLRKLDSWDQLFLDAASLALKTDAHEEKQKMVEHLCKMMIGRDERILKLAKENFTLEFFLNLKDRLIGTGFIGGKSVGLLLSRMILQNDLSCEWHRCMEPHDSYYIGSDVFYSYIVENGWWELFVKQKNPENYFTAAQDLQEKMLEGNFPDQIKDQFQYLIEYFGQSPIIIRSSSLLEDAYGNAFAGKYESIFCVNQGSPQERYKKFISAVRRVYASTMNEDALTYRLQRGLDQMDEQMALLVMRVSGTQHKKYFFPDIGGVGLSYNTYVWNADIKPESGMLRLVYGLGTRAVGRVEGDYPRIVALDSPNTLPLANQDDYRRFSQHRVDVLDVAENDLKTVPLNTLMSEEPDLNPEFVAEKDLDAEVKMNEMGITGEVPWIINFRRLFNELPFIKDMKNILKRLESVYKYPVDIEFTINFTPDNRYMINFLQCRPHQIAGIAGHVTIPDNIPSEKIVFRSKSNFLGGSVSLPIKRIIYIDPSGYNNLPETGKYEVARLVGKLNRQIKDDPDRQTMLLGPGRWGTTTPSLGVPVRFAEINNIKVLVEIAHMSEDIMPDLSFGSHFFLDLVETSIFYVALFPENNGVFLNIDFLKHMENRMAEILPDDKKYKDIINVYEITSKPAAIMSDIVSQDIVCFVK